MIVTAEHPPDEVDQIARVTSDGPLRKTSPLLHLLDHLRKEPGVQENITKMVLRYILHITH